MMGLCVEEGGGGGDLGCIMGGVSNQSRSGTLLLLFALAGGVGGATADDALGEDEPSKGFQSATH